MEKDMASLTFYGGVGEIGGNKFLVEDGDTKIFLDHGQSFSFGEEFSTGWLSPRGRFGLRDHFALNLIPKIKGLYSEASLAPTDYPYVDPEFQGVFISHIHYDHNAHIRYLDDGIPIYLGETTKRMLGSWETTGKGGYGEHDYRTFKTGKNQVIDDIEVEPVHVDHSTPAAYGFIVHTSEGAVVYTGDFRLHGPKAKMTREFIKKAKDAEPIAMICEGTRVSPEEVRKPFSEQGVHDYADRVIKGTDELVVTCFYPRDVDRMKTYHTLAKANNRKFVVSSRVAHLLLSLKDDPGINVPDPINDDNMLIYCRELKRPPKWEKEFYDICVRSDYIHEHQDELIMHLDFTHFTELIDIKPNPGSQFIHSMSEPFEENDIEDAVKHNWLDYFGFKFHQAHASGHCSKEEIFEVINEINPRNVFPVHTEHPGMFKDNVKAKVILPKIDKEFKI